MTNRRVPGRRGVVGLTLLVSLSIVGCGKDSPTGTPTPVATTLTLSATALSFSSLGASDQLTATVRDQNGATMDGASVAWASSASSVASVSSTGLVTAVADGIKGGMKMLVLSRKVGQEIVVGDSVRITVTKVSGNRVTLGVEAPDDVRILRGELRSIVFAFEDRKDTPDVMAQTVSLVGEEAARTIPTQGCRVDEKKITYTLVNPP